MLPSLLTHGASLVPLVVLAYSVVQFSGYIILALVAQLGLEARIQGIITLSDLEGWYVLCLSEKYRLTLGSTLLTDLIREFDLEFPSSQEIEPFIKERGYDKISFPEDWYSSQI